MPLDQNNLEYCLFDGNFSNLDENDKEYEDYCHFYENDNITEVDLPGFKLTNEQKNKLANKNLPKCTRLNLAGQDIDLDFIQQLCKNPSLTRLKYIDLSRNPKITNECLYEILISKNLGSWADTVSGLYCQPTSEIKVRCQKTGVVQSKLDSKYYDLKNNHLHIELDSMTNKFGIGGGVKIITILKF